MFELKLAELFRNFFLPRCKNATRLQNAAYVTVWLSTALFIFPHPAHAQRAKENAVAEADDAFGTTVGREEIGLYSASSARGFSPSQAGNLRIQGLYFDQAQQARPNSRLIRGSSVHVGISAQGYPFPAPTGVVDYKLRAPGDDAVAGGLVGIGSYSQYFGEFDFQTPVSDDVLSIGGGAGYSRNSGYRIAERSWEWTAGALARWQPNDNIVVTPFWSYTDHQERGLRPFVFIGNANIPDYRAIDLAGQPWSTYSFTGSNFGTIANFSFGDSWTLDAGVFRSLSSSGKLNIDVRLADVNALGQGNFSLIAAPRRDSSSTSGEARLSKTYDTDDMRNIFHASIKARDRENETGGSASVALGTGSLSAIPVVPQPTFNTTAVTVIKAKQVTPALGYELIWRDVGQLSLGGQKTFYRRTTDAPGTPVVTSRSKPWLYNASVAGFITQKLAVYASYTRGFEEIGNAPLNAVNRDEAVPAQLTKQIDAGIKYQIMPRLTFVAGVFEISKPYYSLDQVSFFRQLGHTTNRGVEVSLAGNITDRLTLVAGGTFIDANVDYSTGGGAAQVDTVAIGPIPGLIRANLQYRPAFLDGFTFDAKVESTSARYATLTGIRLPHVVTFDAGVRYNTQVAGKPITLRLQTFNLTNEYGLTPSSSSQVQSFDGRRFELSLAFDL